MKDWSSIIIKIVDKFNIVKIMLAILVVLSLMLVPKINYLDFLMPLDNFEKRIRFIFAILIFFVANVGIKLFVIGYNPLLAIVLNVLSISCLSFAFMFAFYRFIVIPVVIVVIDAIIKEITDSSIIFFWI